MTGTRREPDSIDQLLANGKTAVELGKLCIDNPSFCQNGTSLVSSAGSGLLEGSRVALEYLSDRFGTKPQPPAKAEPAASPAVQGQPAFPSRHRGKKPFAHWIAARPARLGVRAGFFRLKRHHGSSFYWSMILSENRFPLFGFMLQAFVRA